MNTKQFVRVAMLTALACVLTIVPKVPIGSGYVHFGDCIIYVAAMILGPIPGAIVGAIGHSLADFISGYPYSVYRHLLLKDIMGFAIGKIVYGHVDIKQFYNRRYRCTCDCYRRLLCCGNSAYGIRNRTCIAYFITDTVVYEYGCVSDYCTDID